MRWLLICLCAAFLVCVAPAVAQAVCGDGVVDGGEGCDDGNTVAGDGCGVSCAVESGYSCTGQPSTCTLFTPTPTPTSTPTPTPTPTPTRTPTPTPTFTPNKRAGLMAYRFACPPTPTPCNLSLDGGTGNIITDRGINDVNLGGGHKTVVVLIQDTLPTPVATPPAVTAMCKVGGATGAEFSVGSTSVTGAIEITEWCDELRLTVPANQCGTCLMSAWFRQERKDQP